MRYANLQLEDSFVFCQQLACVSGTKQTSGRELLGETGQEENAFGLKKFINYSLAFIP